MNTIRHHVSSLLGRFRPGRIRHPLIPDSAVPVTTYPLSREEVRVLAVHWEAERIDTATFCTLTASCGTTDLRIYAHADDRWRAATAVLGDTEMQKVGAEAAARVRAKLGDEVWAAYQTGEAIWADGERERDDPGDDGSEWDDGPNA